jgi:hypothetical protein|tara:strand:- start:64 stop:582 length:519 start_codon:yes stop_codon:yes gene_type:complete
MILKRLNLNSYLVKSNRLLFLLIITFLGVVLNFWLSFIYYDLLGTDLGQENDSLLSIPKNMQFILTIFIAPLIETAFFQYFPIVLTLKTLLEVKIISSYSKKHYYITIIISSFLFALIHTFSIVYFFIAFVMGLYLGYITIISEFVREKRVNVFISVGLIHTIFNLMAIIFD